MIHCFDSYSASPVTGEENYSQQNPLYEGIHIISTIYFAIVFISSIANCITASKGQARKR